MNTFVCTILFIKCTFVDPRDALVSETYVAKEGEPPGPAQAAFNELVPGRAYNISVETVSEGMISDPTTAQYRTVPWRPSNVTFDPNSIGPDTFEVRWSGPTQATEFDRYQVRKNSYYLNGNF